MWYWDSMAVLRTHKISGDVMISVSMYATMWEKLLGFQYWLF